MEKIMDTLKLEYEDAKLANETAENLTNNGFVVAIAKDENIITIIAVRI